jgi:cytochrome c oxidase subunit 3
MAQSTAETLAEHGAGAPEHGHEGGHSDQPFLAHHFDTPRHQFDSGKLGIWIFLATEVLFFGGLFCAYAIYRSLHPEIFVYAHYYLDTFWGALNTGVLIVSSLTAAWAVRNAQLGEQKKLVFNIIATMVLACCFLGVKYVEYSHKFHDNVLPGRHFNPTHEAWELESYKKAHPNVAGDTGHVPALTEHEAAPASPEGVTGALGGEVKQPPPGALPRPRHVSVFFSIYFFMTGLHGVHVVAGIITWGWVLRRALRGEFGPKHFGAVDYTALYWHLVDLIWIYLFPLLYLIH